jgi:hypothetical protein
MIDEKRPDDAVPQRILTPLEQRVLTPGPHQRSVAPNPERPRLSSAIEIAVAPIDEKSAIAYDKAEEAIRLQDILIAGLERGAVGEELDMTESLVLDLIKERKA